jgi:lipoprotein-anchoring transpeptidase ErfK/SrfK
MLLTRREFIIKASQMATGFLAWPTNRFLQRPEFPVVDRLGRVNVGKVEIKKRPNADSQTVSVLYEDAVVEWILEVVGTNAYRNNQRYVETPEGYIWAPYLQPVRNIPNVPVQSLPDSSRGPGMWVEVSVPYVDLLLYNPPPRSPGLQNRLELKQSPRLYFSQVTWVDQQKVNEEGKTQYRLNEPFGGYGDIYWALAEAFRPLMSDEISPISPDVEEKRIEVNISRQTLSCFEGPREVYFCRISSGALWDAWGNSVDAWATPLGIYPIWRKLISLHMSGGSSGGGWDLPAIAWTSLFAENGVAIHSTFWHNNFGEPMSHGCVNASPDDAKWIFRWTLPTISLDPGDETIPWPGGTSVEVNED